MALRFKAEIEFDESKLIEKYQGRLDLAQNLLDEVILAESNRYVPVDTGRLLRSGRIAAPGRIEWDTDYAYLVYQDMSPYGSVPGKRDKNPDARSKWFEHAKAEHLNDWLSEIQTEVAGD